MKIIDLTHEICSDMPVFPGTEPPIIKRANTFEKDGFREAKITMYSHTGTHIDAPAHMLENGENLDDLGIDHFIGNAIVLDYSNLETHLIDVQKLMPYEDKIKKVEFIIIKTDWSKYWGEKRYFEDFPALTEEAADWLAKFSLKGIGIDAISIDSINSKSFSVHKILLSKKILIIENLTNLDSINDEFFVLSILPLKNMDADGSPVRAIAIENIQNS